MQVTTRHIMSVIVALVIGTVGEGFIPSRVAAYVPDDLDFPVMEEPKKTPPSTERLPLPGDRKGFSNSIGMKFVYIPPGTFLMGSPSNEPGKFEGETQHQVTLTKGYYMGVTEVTQGQWRAVMGNNPSRFSNCGDDCPVESVSWNDCQEFIRRLNQKEGGSKYRLPTEAEWEYACRAGSTGAYAGDLDSMAWYDSNSGNRTHPVGRKKPNAWGLHDMHGNVWEWCENWYGEYPSGSVTDPKGPSSPSYRVSRGGSWSDDARRCRSAGRFRYTPEGRSNILGFRLARTE